MARKNLYRLLFYAIGLLILSLGVTLNSKACLGVAPMISVSFSISEIFELSFGNVTMLWYDFFVLIEIILHVRLAHKKPIPLKWVLLFDLAQIPLSAVFSRFMNLYDALLPDFSTDGLGTHLVVLTAAIICTGVGASMMLNMRLVPNPGDGIVQAISDTIGKDIGFSKNCFDFTCLLITIFICFFLSKPITGIGFGTLLAMIFTGRVMAIFNHFTQKPMQHLANVSG